MSSSTSIGIGDMRQKGTFRQNAPIDNGSGGQSDNYTDLLTCRGRLRKLKGNKGLEDSDVVQNKGYEWVCRFQLGIVINVDTALVINGTYYRISDYEKIDELNHFYRFIIQSFQ